jgi:hypothetical protein
VNRRGARISEVGEFLRQDWLGVEITSGSFGRYLGVIDLLECAAGLDIAMPLIVPGKDDAHVVDFLNWQLRRSAHL